MDVFQCPPSLSPPSPLLTPHLLFPLIPPSPGPRDGPFLRIPASAGRSEEAACLLLPAWLFWHGIERCLLNSPHVPAPVRSVVKTALACYGATWGEERLIACQCGTPHVLLVFTVLEQFLKSNFQLAPTEIFFVLFFLFFKSLFIWGNTRDSLPLPAIWHFLFAVNQTRCKQRRALPNCWEQRGQLVCDNLGIVMKMWVLWWCNDVKISQYSNTAVTNLVYSVYCDISKQYKKDLTKKCTLQLFNNDRTMNIVWQKVPLAVYYFQSSSVRMLFLVCPWRGNQNVSITAHPELRWGWSLSQLS